MPQLRRVSTEVYASHHQFYLADGSFAGDDPDFWAGAASAGLWDGAALERHLDAVPGMVAVGTVAYGVVPIAVELWDAEPPDDFAAWDHMAEAWLDAPSGRLVLGSVDGWEPGSGEIEVEPASYRARIAAAGLDSAAETEGGDSYRLQLWPGPPVEPRVLEWWAGWDPAGVTPQPSAGGGRLLVGAEADDARVRMHWLASRGEAHLFVDDAHRLWEHSNLRDAGATPQLEELPTDEAERRYGPRSGWSGAALDASARGVLRELWRSALRRGSR